jgi:hypothetical protein
VVQETVLVMQGPRLLDMVVTGGLVVEEMGGVEVLDEHIVS